MAGDKFKFLNGKVVVETTTMMDRYLGYPANNTQAAVVRGYMFEAIGEVALPRLAEFGLVDTIRIEYDPKIEMHVASLRYAPEVYEYGTSASAALGKLCLLNKERL